MNSPLNILTQAKLVKDWDATSVGINFNFFRRQVVNVKVAQYMPSFQVSKAKKQIQSEGLRHDGAWEHNITCYIWIHTNLYLENYIA